MFFRIEVFTLSQALEGYEVILPSEAVLARHFKVRQCSQMFFTVCTIKNKVWDSCLTFHSVYELGLMFGHDTLIPVM